MSQSLSAFLDHAPSFDEIAAEMEHLGIEYRHSLPGDARVHAALHVFGLDDLRIVYYEGDAANSRAVVKTTVRRGDTAVGAARLWIISARMVQRWGGEVYDPQIKRRVPVN